MRLQENELTHPLIADLRRELWLAADASKAPAMRAYMKSEMPFHGVQSTALRAIQRRCFARHPLDGFEVWREVTLQLWREARYREERYAAIALTGYKAYQEYQGLRCLPMYEEMIVTGAWWDYVDAIASHRLGELLRRHPRPMKTRMLSWSRCRDLWKRRAAILCQLGFKRETDLDLLYACILQSAGDPEFFLRKAIGWALRQYAWTDPAEVRRFVQEHESELSPLSRREACKNVAR